jgi:tetratricopeptide (TPR) repeat protein
LHSHKLISNKSVDALFASYSPRQLGALGFSEYSDDTKLIYHQHHGSSVNFEALATYRAEEDTAIILLTNNKNRKLFEITGAVEAILDGDATYRIPRKPIDVAIADECIVDVTACLETYEQLKKTDPELYDFDSENALNRLGYRLMRGGNPKGAIEVFKKNVAVFPKSANPYDSLGEAYAMIKNPELALENYSKSLELNPNNTNAAEMIKKIKAWQKSE